MNRKLDVGNNNYNYNDDDDEAKRGTWGAKKRAQGSVSSTGWPRHQSRHERGTPELLQQWRWSEPSMKRRKFVKNPTWAAEAEKPKILKWLVEEKFVFSHLA